MPRLVYATRRSALALAQCRAFVARLAEAHPDLELVEEQVVTTGDTIQDRPLSEVGGKGLFVKEIEEALLERRADFAVHSIKDVPGVMPQGLSIACVPPREDPRDVLVLRQGASLTGLADLPRGATIGTSSLRRAVALRAARPDLAIVPMRGNVDTRLRKVDAGECDAIVLARAGLVRLGLESRATYTLDPSLSLPAVGQGALGIEVRSDDEPMKQRLAAVHDPRTAVAVAAERGVLIALEGDCKTPLAAYAEETEGTEGGPLLHLRAFVVAGDRMHTADEKIPWPDTEIEADAFGRAVARRLR